jgi:dTDP-glucose pyrophosphorylase
MINDGLCMLMPMAGRGSRFKDHGIILPKPLIQISGKPFFYWSTLGVIREFPNVQLVYVVLREHIEMFNIDKQIKFYFPQSKIAILEDVTSGALETALAAVPYVDPKAILIVNDCDHAFSYNNLKKACQSINEGSDGFLTHFNSNFAHYSYAAYSENGCLLRTVEKQVISNYAIAGVYGFKNMSELINVSQIYTKNCQYSELFISGVYNEMVNLGAIIHGFYVDYHIAFGTPDEFKVANQHIADLNRLII